MPPPSGGRSDDRVLSSASDGDGAACRGIFSDGIGVFRSLEELRRRCRAIRETQRDSRVRWQPLMDLGTLVDKA